MIMCECAFIGAGGEPWYGIYGCAMGSGKPGYDGFAASGGPWYVRMYSDRCGEPR
ncbi:hypothetical protein GCM10010913_14670 [Paenibacillus aceti]|uniref:Uncharacterized protein n=1 Tax=Paenibacillus aceti TaxID=1820010 RepID=A0ABQ1VU04_9BACL|nr:hypothetical protein GCM10010913_14670 [Paenibacillus aceti]